MMREERQEIETLCLTYPTRRAVALEALKVIQRRKRWISDQDLYEVAAMLEMTAAELDSLATFYSQIFRRPVGRHVIRTCDSISCWIVGATGLEERLEQLLGIRPGETTGDSGFTWLPVSCLGVCEQGPAMMVDNDLYTRVKSEDLDAILQRYVQEGAAE